MKKYSILNKLLFFINSVLAAVLLFSYALPFISPKTIPAVAVFSLFVPLLVILNLFFFVYWLLKLHKNALLSLLILLIGWFASPPLIKFSNKEIILNNDLKVMSYNVRLFNHYKHEDDITTEQQIYEFINNESPDIIAMQEFYQSELLDIKLPYKYIKTKSKTNQFGLAIYSKYPIVNSGSLNFKNSANNTIFIDVVKKKDTIRIYNVHLESLKINPKKENFGEKNSERLFKRLANGFEKQVDQTELILQHEYSWKGKKIVCGDFNNTAYSWVYNKLSKNKKDAFIASGIGLGKSFRYIYPMRIDFIFTDKAATINQYKTYSDIKLSDHYPIMTRLHW
ncbi:MULTISPECIES: endonuclease/exonuclease/phosphatase family protein [Tenacibaculum]|uniref:Endonuclease/exonuclease/phosphatase family protein n=1 Tax=Tenacibaculum aiptasiae TaxID=426481 RepID=A0A7J5AQE5_9FLAO|nr:MULTISPECIES: endonuclease/exonuclease/phosphatase family protein [Tenacibaculum]KAB1159839.1 endonuclease/exonuclease/phosphatase family protein [Tenacibaculum aiptasiae]MCF2874150.1 endonuclease/exonuclease/phosphatase family protein [Tenacibaculum sp. Cn5-1]MCF2934731.1 endonuclease/exonuclease/phosphatase family protein [Tenacibaculum sp. Cn5-34]MCG7510941.1 endonuclease/exonuclease/phosphatase family protein [Tenacibaculum sp. Cn5-46]